MGAGASSGSLAGDAVNPPGERTAEEGGGEIRIEITIEIKIEIKITSRSRSGVVERLSMGGRWDGPPWPLLRKGGNGGAWVSLVRGASSGSLAKWQFQVACITVRRFV